MVTLLGDVHFWTLRDDIVVKDADIGAFRYQDKSTVSRERVYYEDKRGYLERRGVLVAPKNSRPHKLRDAIKELEDVLSRERVVWQGWVAGDTYQLVLSSGVMATLGIHTPSGDLATLTFEKFLAGKLLSEHLADFVMTKTHLIFSYNESRLTVVHLTRPAEGRTTDRLATADPKVYTCEVAGPSGRRFERKLSTNLSGDMVVVWWRTSDDEVYPWSPLAKDRDRANILVYALHGHSLDLVCYCRTEMAPLSVAFSRVQPNVLLTVEQGFGKKGGVTVLSCVYEVDRGALHRMTVTTIPLEAPLTAHAHNPSEDRLLLACNNGVLALHCDARGMTHVTKAGLIPTNIAWLDSGNVVVVSNDRGQVQCFDLALSLIRMQLVMEDPSPQRILDLSEHFCHQQSLQKMSWAPTKSEDPAQQHSIPHLLLLHYVRGPIACLRVDVSAVCSDGLTAPALVAQYIKHRQVDEAVNLLVSLNWDQEGPVAIRCLTAIVNHLLRLPLSQQREAQVETALGSFHVPVQPLSQAVEEEFGPAVRALTRRFFFSVLRMGRLDKAFRLAVDLKDHDCFMALHSVARRRGEEALAATALHHARDLDSSGSCSSVLYGHSDTSASESCSDTCSTCFSETGSDSGSESGSEYSDNGSRDPYGGDGRLEVITEHNSSYDSATQLPQLCGGVGAMSLSNGGGQVHSVGTSANLVMDNASTVTHATAITSQDGTVTINIRQPDRHSPSKPVHPDQLPSKRSSHLNQSSSKRPIPHTEAGAKGAKPEPHEHLQARGRGARPTRPVREVFYSSDPNEEFVDSERVSVFVDKEDLQKQYERAVFHEVSTEEEDGGTVKVVHFGVV